MVKNKGIVILLVATLVFSCTKPAPVNPEQQLDGLVLNEVCPARTVTRVSWLEIYNPTEVSVKLNGLRITFAEDGGEEELIATLSKGEVAPGDYYVVSSDEHDFAKPVLRATFGEMSICDRDGTVISSFSVKFDCPDAIALEDGYSYSRLPDATGKWGISNVATPGEPNYTIVPHTLTSIVINEVCKEKGWIEIVNNYKGAQNFEYAYIAANDGTVMYTFQASSVIAAGERTVAECTSGLDGFALYTNTGKKVVEFSSTGLADPAAGGSWSRLPDVTGAFKAVTTATRGDVNSDIKDTPEGIVINEVCKSEGWVEISNSNLENTIVPVLNLYLIGSGETLAATFDAATFKPGDKAVRKVILGNSTGLVLCTASGQEVDRVNFSDVSGSLPSDVRCSWSRIPDGTGRFYAVRTPSEGEKNYGIQQDNNIALWVPQSATNTVDLEHLCKLGYGQIILHEYAFKNYGTEKVRSLVRQAESLGQTLHIWMQCFWWNDSIGWRLPVIDRVGDTPAAYNQAMFDEIINRAKPYVNAGVHGIHFDYIRFGGTAQKHTFPEDGITGVGAITEFCRQANVTLKGMNPKIVLSAAVMGEKAPQNSYGQDISQMSSYIDAFLPMAYISSYGYGPTTNAGVAQWFKDKAGIRKVWHGVSTYDSNSTGLSAERIYDDCKNVADRSTVDGVALFRYGIGTLPDMNNLFKK